MACRALRLAVGISLANLGFSVVIDGTDSAI